MFSSVHQVSKESSPSTPQKKDQTSKSEVTANEFLLKKMMQNPKILQEYTSFLQNQQKKANESAGSSSDSTFDRLVGHVQKIQMTFKSCPSIIKGDKKKSLKS